MNIAGIHVPWEQIIRDALVGLPALIVLFSLTVAAVPE
jgi:hypothetical protein